MDPISLSLAIAPLVFSSAKLLAAVGSIRHRYNNAQTAVTSTQTECELMHVVLCEVQGLVHRNRVELAIRLRSQKSLEETFDKVLTGCRDTLDALTLELDDLLKPSKGRGGMGYQSKTQYVWKKDTMEDLMEQMRSQRDCIQVLITILHSDTQAEILRLVQKNASCVQKFLNKAKSIRSLQGFDDTQSVLASAESLVQYPFGGFFEEQLQQSPAYRKAQAVAAEDLLAAKLELLEEKYNLEETLDNLRTEVVLKQEAITALDRTVGNNIKEIRNLQHENESLKKSIHQLNQNIEALQESPRSKEPIDLQKPGEVDLLNQHSHATQNQELSEKEKDSLFEKLKLNGFPLSSGSAWYSAALNGNICPLRYTAYHVKSKLWLTYLPAASASGHIEIVKYLLKEQSNWMLRKTSLDAKTLEINGLNLMQLASANGHNTVVKELIAAGADVNAPAAGLRGRTALQAAAEGGHIDVVETLVNAGADVNAPRAMLTAENSLQSPLGYLQESGYGCGGDGMSALQAAAAGGNAEIAERLLKAGASTPDVSALRSATQNGHLELVRILLGSGDYRTANPDVLMSAVRNGHLQIVKALLKSGFTISDPHLFITSVLNGNIQILEALIDACVAKRGILFIGYQALRVATAKEDLQAIDALLAGKARICSRSSTPTVLDEAIDTRNIPILKRLLTSASEIDRRDQDCSAAYQSALRSAESQQDGGNMLSVLESSEFGKFKGRKDLRFSRYQNFP